MADNQRIEDLRRRVQKDPASIAFAQLAEECRRAGQVEESVEICRAGLAIHPGYLSARVTLGRALLELNLLDDALAELEHVLASAPENLAAIRGIAEIHHRRGNLSDALSHYRAALALAKNDPDLEQTVADLSRKVEPPKPPSSDDGLSLEQITSELSIHKPPARPTPVAAPTPAAAPALAAPRAPAADALPAAPAQQPRDFFGFGTPAPQIEPAPPPLPLDSQPANVEEDQTRVRATQTIAALEQWLDAIHVARTHHSA